MEFWGKEVKPGIELPCKGGDGYVIHLSQAALGETKKVIENVVVSIKVGDKKLVIGTLSSEKHPQIMCDLIFDDDFELSHSSKTTSVFFTGYKTELSDAFESDSNEDEVEELETPKLTMIENDIKISAGAKSTKDGKKDKQDYDDETSSSSEAFSDDLDSEMSGDDEFNSEDEVSTGTDDLSDSEDESSDDKSLEEEETPIPKKPEGGKKRTSEVALKTPISGKKAKVEPSGQKTGDAATPHPVKQTSKIPAGDKKSKSPKSGSHACKSCNKTFGSESALESHQKAKKHEA